MLRRLAVIALVGSVTAALAPPAVRAQDTVSAPPDRLRAFSIAPPGQDGNLNAEEFASSEYGPHYADQLEMYASLIDDDDVAEDELSKYFHSMQFGPGQTIESSVELLDGLTIHRDGFGIPHVYAENLDKASYGLGYVTAQDRLFEMDAFRHAARGTLAAFAGPGTGGANLQADIETRRQGYTEEEVQAMFDAFDDKFGEVGKKIQSGLKAYADGVNAYIETLVTNPSNCPVEYNATGNPCPGTFPEEWKPTDTLFIVILQLREFGETAGGELRNAGFYSRLVDKLGKAKAEQAYADLLFQNDPASPPTAPAEDARFPGQNLGRLNRKSLAIPDHAGRVAARIEARESAYRETLQSFGVPFDRPQSNAILVAGKRSTTGNPMQTGAPQVGYATPGFFLEVDVHVAASGDDPAIDFRGPAVAGTSALVPLGRGTDYAWTLTTGYSDAVDTRAELLCEPDGGRPTQNSNGYMFKGECKKMESREETFTVHPTPTNPGPPREETRTIYRTVHGPVSLRGTVDGKPVAFVKERFFWKREVDSIPSFYRWNAETSSVRDFQRAASGMTMSFNTFYVDTKDIGYFHVGYLPKRSRGVSPSLPTWGTGQWEWKGRLPFAQMPKVVNPERGWIANWNSKPSAGWTAADDFKWGTIQRVRLIEDDLKRLFKSGGKATLSDLVDVLRNVATRDPRAAYLGPRMLKLAGSQEGELGQATAIVRSWIEEGAHRLNKDRDDNMDKGNSLALFDTWYTKLVHAVFDDELGDEAFGFGPPVTDYDPAYGSSFYFDFSNYLYDLFSATGAKRYRLDYCDDIATDEKETCKTQVVKALTQAVDQLKQEQGVDMSAWVTPGEWIVFDEFGAGSVDPIPWQNRGTHNHVVEALTESNR